MVLFVVSTVNHQQVRAVWSSQIPELVHHEDKNVFWTLAGGQMSISMFTFAPQHIPPEVVNMNLPVYVKLIDHGDNDLVSVGGKHVHAHVKMLRTVKGRVTSYFDVHDQWVSMLQDARRANGHVMRRFGMDLKLPMNGCELETIDMRARLCTTNVLRGIRPIFRRFELENGVGMFLSENQLIYGPDDAMESIPTDKVGNVKLGKLLEAIWRPDQYLIYVGAAPGHSINKYLRMCTGRREAILLDPRPIFVDKRSKMEIKIVTGDAGYVDAVSLLEIIDAWVKNPKKTTTSILLFSDIRREKEAFPTQEEWVAAVDQDNTIQHEMISALRSARVPAAYLAKHRVPNEGEGDHITLHDRNCSVFRAAYSRKDLYELREYCTHVGGEEFTFALQRDACNALLDDGEIANFSLTQHRGLMSLQLEDALTHDDYRPSVDLYYLTNARNKWTYESFFAKASSSAFATWWAATHVLPMNYDDVPIPAGWFTRACDENSSLAVFDGDLFLHIVQKLNGFNTMRLDYEWESHFVVTVNMDLVKRTHPDLANRCRYSIDSYFSQSRGLRDGANARKRFSPSHATAFTRVKSWVKDNYKYDLSGHLRMMILDGEMRNYDFPRWIRQVFASNVAAGLELRQWDLVDAASAKQAQSGVVPYEVKGVGHHWHTRNDLVWTIATMEILLEDVPKACGRYFIPSGVSLAILGTDRDDLDSIKAILRPAIRGME